ncbi:MAG: Sec-independent protein translocase subunit TatA/TatB [Armatimonadota bacterium]|jgi:sec-independent protein translocase protein TatA
MFSLPNGPELIFIIALALIVFGPKRLPEIGKSIGKGLRELRKASREITDAFQDMNLNIDDDDDDRRLSSGTSFHSDIDDDVENDDDDDNSTDALETEDQAENSVDLPKENDQDAASSVYSAGTGTVGGDRDNSTTVRSEEAS